MSNDEKYYSAETFEEKLQVLIPNITEAQFLAGAEQIEFMCKCRSCPNFKSSTEKKIVRCVIGKIYHTLENRSCLCRSCQYTKMMNLRWDFYCAQGSALDLSESEKKSNTTIPLKGTY